MHLWVIEVKDNGGWLPTTFVYHAKKDAERSSLHHPPTTHIRKYVPEVKQ